VFLNFHVAGRGVYPEPADALGGNHSRCAKECPIRPLEKGKKPILSSGSFDAVKEAGHA
jgi:hypothetical protein